MKTVLALVFTVGIAAAGHAADRIAPPPVPAGLEVSSIYKPFLMGHAVGTQNYICAPSPEGPKWLFIGPQATVFDSDAGQILTHFQSTNPYKNAIHATWQHSRDSSAVWAKRANGSTDPSYVAPDAVEWLLLEVTGAISGPAGGDKLLSTIYIQRVNTQGGKEPSATECNAGTLNNRRLVPYEADYIFYR